MMAIQNVTTTETMPNKTKIGIGGTNATAHDSVADRTHDHTDSDIHQHQQNPLLRLGVELTKLGLAPHVTPMMISIGMMEAITKMTQLPNVGKSNSEMTPRETAMIRMVDTIPSAGCFKQSSYLGSESSYYITRGQNPVWP